MSPPSSNRGSRLALDPITADWLLPIIVGRGLEVMRFVQLEPWVTRGALRTLVVADFDGGAGLEVLARRSAVGSPPCLMIVPRDAREAVAACVAAGATDVVEEGDLSGLFAALINALGLRGSVEPRREFRTPVLVRCGLVEHDAEGMDLRSSGIALRGFHGALAGHVAELTFKAFGEPLCVFARVVRAWRCGLDRFVALRFLGLEPRVRAWLDEVLEASIRKPSEVLTDLDAWRREVREAFGLPEIADESPPADSPFFDDADANETIELSVAPGESLPTLRLEGPT